MNITKNNDFIFILRLENGYFLFSLTRMADTGLAQIHRLAGCPTQRNRQQGTFGILE